jgi:rubrerythrin
MDVLRSAVKHEREAIKLYKYLANEASLVSLKMLFSSLLEDEQKHLERITNYKISHYDEYQPDIHEFLRLFPQIVKDQGIDGLSKEEVEFYQEVMECKENGINQYRHFLSNARDEKSKKLLTELISQEKTHFDIVKGLCVYITEQQNIR